MGDIVQEWPDGLTVTLASSVDEVRPIEQVRSSVWGGDCLSVQPETAVHIHNGGAVLLAQLREEIVGFSLSFPSNYRGKLVLWSHETAVTRRNLKIGSRLKLAQRQVARTLGYESIMWTFDPLVRRNAHINLVKLGASVEDFVQDYYGTILDDSQTSLFPSDRFIVSWPTPAFDSESITDDRDCSGPGEVVSEFIAEPVEDSAVFTTEIPEDIVVLRASDPDLAMYWTTSFRAAWAEARRRGLMLIGAQVDSNGYMVGYRFCRPTEKSWKDR